MANVYQGKLIATDLRVGIVVSRFNDLITGRLLEGALDALERHGAAPSAVDVAWVPGAFEIPLVARRLALSGRYQAVICLARSSAARRRTLITSPAPSRVGSRMRASKRAFRWFTACSPRIP